MIGRSAGNKTCDECGAEYAGPAFYTFRATECSTWNDDDGKGPRSPHVGCTENLCPVCAYPNHSPDRPDDPRRLTRPMAH